VFGGGVAEVFPVGPVGEEGGEEAEVWGVVVEVQMPTGIPAA
jgi:hypothetical protein